MRKKAIGIDLGTTNSVMAVVREDMPEIIPMGTNDDQVLRSAVYFSNIGGQNHVSFGKEAIERGTEIGSTENFKFDFKRDIGRPIASDTPDHTRVNSIILSALVLNEFRKRAYVVGQEMGQADGIKDAVITVPAYFTSDQRAATKNAGRIAGFNVLRIINEPTAAAIAYAHTKNAQGNVLVFDLGGGTFDVTIMRVADHAYDILATDGNSRLGGIDFDKRLVGYIMQELEKQGVNMTNLSEKEKIQLQYKAEQIKTSLSVNDQALYEHYVNGQGYGVLITQAIFNEITLDLLKEGNDTLRHVMQVLGRHIRPDEAAARGEAGHFFLCLHEHREDAVIARLGEIRADVNAFNAQRETPYYLTLLTGAYLVQEPGLDITVMQDRADAARKSKPAENGRCAFYDAGITARMHLEKELVNLLDSSLANRDFKVYYQPKVRLRDGQVASAEALVRWQHPQKGFIYPSDFIPVFERSGDICRLDLYVFEEVCAMLAGRLAQGAPVFPVAVNLSRRHFQTTDFLQRFADIRDQYQIPGGLIELELTESIFFTVGDILNVKEAIRRMHELGFLCSLDDFGAGFSSLGLLKSFMVDSVKLDRSFFLDDSQRAHDVVESIVELARKLGIETVAEGIEAPEQVDFLRSIGCDLVQGYVYARPMPAEELEAWMRARHGGEVTQI